MQRGPTGLSVKSATKRVGKTPTHPKTQGRARNATITRPELPRRRMVAHSKALLLAALRYWELKHRVSLDN
jgi:hypothetical protein